jgi:hypothetical protein
VDAVGHDRGFVTLRLLYLILRTAVGWLGLLTRAGASKDAEMCDARSHIVSERIDWSVDMVDNSSPG